MASGCMHVHLKCVCKERKFIWLTADVIPNNLLHSLLEGCKNLISFIYNKAYFSKPPFPAYSAFNHFVCIDDLVISY